MAVSSVMCGIRIVPLIPGQNVTYGYTSATYSGRMPCIEVGSTYSSLRNEAHPSSQAQELIHSRAEWAAQVVYGDTDSLFVALPGRSKEQAFKIGNEIADAVTATNPKPVKLKFEKVRLTLWCRSAG
jgi:DNA polymerase zeta